MSRLTSFLTPGKSQDDEKGDGSRFKNCIIGAREKFFTKPYQSSLSSSSRNNYKENVPLQNGTNTLNQKLLSNPLSTHINKMIDNNGEKTNFRRTLSDRLKKVPSTIGLNNEASTSSVSFGEIKHSPLRQSVSLNTTVKIVTENLNMENREPSYQEMKIPYYQDASKKDLEINSNVLNMESDKNKSPIQLVNPESSTADAIDNCKHSQNDSARSSLKTCNFSTTNRNTKFSQNYCETVLDDEKLVCLICQVEKLQVSYFHSGGGSNQTLNVPWTVEDICRFLLRPQSKVRYYMLNRFNTTTTRAPNSYSLKFPRFPKSLSQSRKSSDDVSNLLNNPFFHQLSHLLSHVWLKLSELIQKLSSRFHKCTKLEVISAIKIMIPTMYLKELCISNCSKAVTNYAVSSDNFKISKSERAGLYFDVGKFQRWMVEFNIATFVKEYAPVYAAALMETLSEEMCIMVLMGYNNFSILIYPELEFNRDDVDLMNMFFRHTDGLSTNIPESQDILSPLISQYISKPETLYLQDVLIMIDTFVLASLLLGRPQVPLNAASILKSALECYNRHLRKDDLMGHLTPNGKVIHMAVAKFKHNTLPNIQSGLSNEQLNGLEVLDLKEKIKINMTSVNTINEICNTFCSLDYGETSNNIDKITQFLWINPNYQIHLNLSSFSRKSRLNDSAHFDDISLGQSWDTSYRNYHTINAMANMSFNSHTVSTKHRYYNLSTSRCPHSGPLNWTREAIRIFYHYFRCPRASALNFASLSSGSQKNNENLHCSCKGWLSSLTDQFIAKDSDNKGKRFERKHSCDSINLDSPNVLNVGGHIRNLSEFKMGHVCNHRPCLYNWITAIIGFAEHRDGNCILPEDVFQAVSLLLPNNNYPPPSLLSIHEELKAYAFNPTNNHHQTGENEKNERLLSISRKLLAFQMLSADNIDLVPVAINLFNLKNDDFLGRLKATNQQDFSASNNIPELSISPLMYSTIEGNLSIIKTLLSLGVDIDQDVSFTEVNCCPFLPRYYSEIYHWTALSFAVMFSHYDVVQLLLENGANVEGGIKFGEELCFSETPLQLASAAGYLDMVTLILTKGGDPYLCTAYNHRSSCCLPPSPSPLLGIVEGGGNGSQITASTSPFNLQNASFNSYNSFFSVPSTSSNSHHRQELLLSPPHFRSGATSRDGIEITTSYSNLPHRHRINSATCCGVRAGSHAPFILAASHGRLDVLKKLLAQPLVPKPRDILSLEEILAEGCSMFLAGASQGSTNSHSPIPPNFYDKNPSNDNGSNKDVNTTLLFSKLNVLPSIFTFPTFSNNGNVVNSSLNINDGISKKEASEIDLDFNQIGSHQANLTSYYLNSNKTINKGNPANLDLFSNNNASPVDSKANGKAFSVPESNSLIPPPDSLGNLTPIYVKDKSRRHSQPKMFSKRSTMATESEANDYLTLEEILAEGYMPPGPPSTSMNGNNNRSPNLINKGFLKRSNCVLGLNSKNVNIGNLTKAQGRVLMEALYHAAESGHVEICMELRNLGIPWNLHIWIKCLMYVYDDSSLSKKFLVSILCDFANVKLEEVNIPELMEIALPILLDIFYESSQETESSKGDNKYVQQVVDDTPSTFILVSRIISTCYTNGIKPIKDIIPAIERTTQSLRSTLIDPCYVNSSELSDISFMVEGQIFYGHKIILVNSSPRFKAMLSNKFAEGTQNIIEIPEIRYAIFKVIMEFLYSGKIDSITNQSLNFILELMAASNFFLLDGLQRECEILCSKIINNDNCVSIYKTAMLYACEELAKYCVGYFMKNMPVLIMNNSGFIEMLSTSSFSNELHARIYHTLMARLQERTLNLQVNGNYGGPQNNYTCTS